MHYFNIVCKSQKRRVELANRQYSNNIRFKKDKKAFNFAEIHFQMFKELIKSKYHEIINKPHHIYIMQFSLRKSRITITSLTPTWKVDDSMDNSQYASQHIP